MTFFQKIKSLARETFFILKDSQISSKSAEITYTFLLSVLPFLAVIFALVHFFNGFENIFVTAISPLIINQFGSEIGLQISTYLESLIKNVQVKELGIISFGTFTFTTILLLLKIEDLLDEIIHEKKRSGFFIRLFKCALMIFLSPFLFILSSIKSDPLIELIHSFIPTFIDPNFLKNTRFFVSFATQIFGFMLIYYVMPSKKVKFYSILIGGFFAAFLLEILQYVNVIFVKQSMNSDPNQIYGTTPLIVVLFIIWIRLVWMVALSGFAITVAAEKVLYTPQSSGGEQ